MGVSLTTFCLRCVSKSFATLTAKALRDPLILRSIASQLRVRASQPHVRHSVRRQSSTEAEESRRNHDNGGASSGVNKTSHEDRNEKLREEYHAADYCNVRTQSPHLLPFAGVTSELHSRNN